MRRPPLFVVLVAVLMIALGETAGAVISELRGPVERQARARVAAQPRVHGLAGTAEYDEEVTNQTVFTVEAGLSFLHTHAEGMGLVVFFAGTLVASTVGPLLGRRALYALLAVGGLFPLGYLVYSVAVLELGRDAGVGLAEQWVLTPLGSATIAGLLGLAWALLARLRRQRRGGLGGS